MKRAKTPSRKAEQSAATLERVMLASMELFARQGIHATSMDQIAHRARLTKGAIYWHFRSKNALLDAILKRIKEDWQRIVLLRVREGATPLIKVDSLFENYCTLLSEQPEICLFLQRAMLEPSTSVSRKVNEVFDRTATAIATVFDEGKASGLFLRKSDSKVLAFSVLSSFAGAVTHCHSDKTLRFVDLMDEIKSQTVARLTGVS